MIQNVINDVFKAGLFRGEVRYDEPMSSHTSLRIGGTIDIMAFPEDPLSLRNIMHAADRQGCRFFIIGAGTNMLVSDRKMQGVAISLREFKKIELTRSADDDKVVLFVGAGVPLSGLINHAKRNGYSGLEALAGIPGSLGGAVFMNAGSHGTEIKDVIESIAVMNKYGEIYILERDKLNFSYRKSNLPDGVVILSANISLVKDSPEEVADRIRDFLQRKKTSQPLGQLSAGCVFKNPAGDSAGRLIDVAGCKGIRRGDVEVSGLHANYFINKGHASFGDFVEMMKEVHSRVKASSGIDLEPEIKIVAGSDEVKYFQNSERSE